jgi:hypothetical protein
MTEKNKNKRIKIVEADLVDNAEVELTDLLNASSKAEKAILDLCDKCLAFKDQALKSMVLHMKERAADVTKRISQLGISGGRVNDTDDQLGGDVEGEITDSSNLDARGNKQRLDLESSSVFESVKAKYLKRKKLKEFSGLELEAEEPDDSAEQELSKEKQVIKDNTYEKPGVVEDEEPEAGDMDGKVVIDLTEPFEQVVKGLDPQEFASFKGNVIAHLEGAIDDVEHVKDSAVADEFAKTIEALSATQSVDDFDMGMEQIYDFADEHDILVETIKLKK